ncbi:MAG: flagellar hook-associated protein 3 FlgL [Clostridia bacterium]|nr:flagellar hook-associated protein 3 FlgL [Clostridia bacterium]
MRITNHMLSRNVIRNITHNLEVMSKTQEQMASGHTVNRPSDDPIYTARILSFKSSIAADDQYKKNMEDAKGWLDASDGALDLTIKVLQRARELAVYGSNGTLPKNSMEAQAKEVDQLIDELKQTANISYGGRYLFGGTDTTEVPFEKVGNNIVYKGNTGSLEWEIAPNVTMAVNENGQKIFMEAIDSDGDGVKDKGIFDLLGELSTSLKSGDYQAVSNTLGDFSKAVDHVLSIRATLGAKSNRMELAMARLDESQLSLKETMSKLADVDLAEVVMNYKAQEYVYQAALATGAKVLQPSLIDYLR